MSVSKTAIITGAAAGIGKACALQLAREGHGVIIVDLSKAGVEKALGEIVAAGGEAAGISGDVSDTATHENAAAAALKRWGRIDVLVANAGVQTKGRLLDATDADWERVLAVNVRGVARACKAVLPEMIGKKQGAIVMVSSVNALRGCAGMAAYDASKAAVLGLMRNLAVEHGRDGVRVNAVCPGNTLTDFHINCMAEKGIGMAQLREMTRGYGLLGRAAEPHEIAAAICFLAGDGASFITGQELAVDGGYTLAPRS